MLHSHLRMTGAWGVYRRGRRWRRSPRRAWLVLRARRARGGASSTGPLLELMTEGADALRSAAGRARPRHARPPSSTARGSCARLRADDPTRRDRRRAARPAQRRRDREHLEGRGLLGGRRSTRGAAVAAGVRRRGDGGRSSAMRPRMRESARDGPARDRARAVYGRAGGRARAAATPIRRPRPGRRTTARPTGARDVSADTQRVGHKGADLIAPGNTTRASTRRCAAGVDMIEFDVLPERGPVGRLVLAHDYEDAAGRDAADARGGARAPGLATRSPASSSTSTSSCRATSSRVLDALREPGCSDRALISSQYRESLAVIRAAEPRGPARLVGPEAAPRPVPATALTWFPALAAAATACARGAAASAPRARSAPAQCDALMAHWRLVTPRLVAACAAPAASSTCGRSTSCRGSVARGARGHRRDHQRSRGCSRRSRRSSGRTVERRQRLARPRCSAPGAEVGAGCPSGRAIRVDLAEQRGPSGATT